MIARFVPRRIWTRDLKHSSFLHYQWATESLKKCGMNWKHLKEAKNRIMVIGCMEEVILLYADVFNVFGDMITPKECIFLV